MRIQLKVKVLVLLIMMAVLVIGGITLYRAYEKMTFIGIFQNEARNKETNFDKIFMLKGESLDTFVYDYTYWDEMVDFTINRDQLWAEDNLGTDTLVPYKASALWVYSKDFSFMYSVHNLGTGNFTELPLAPEAFKHLFTVDKDFCHFYLNTSQGLMEIRGASIHPSADVERKTPDQGYFFAGRLYDENYIKDLAKITGTTITFSPFLIETKTNFDQRTNLKKGIISFSRTVMGWNGSPVACFNIQSESVLIKQFNHTSRGVFISLVFITAGGILFIFAFFRQWIYFPLALISRALRTDKPEFINGLQGKQDEFGDISRLISRFFEQRQRLIREINERRKTEEELLNSESRFRDVAENSGDWIWEVDAQGKYMYSSPVVAKILGYRPEEIIGKYFYDFFYPGEREYVKEAAFKKFMSKQPFQFFLNRNEHKDGRIIILETSAIPHLADNGELLSYRGVSRDISERKRMEEELKESHRDLENKVRERTKELEEANEQLKLAAQKLAYASKIKSEFLANMSHELRTPLNSVIGFSEILYDQTFGPLSEKQQEYVGYVLTSGKHLLSLINDVLDFSKMDAEKMKLTITSFCLKDLLTESLRLVKEVAVKRDIGLSFEIDREIGGINTDERALKQTIYNLLSNAIKFTPEGGKVGIRAKKGDQEIEITVWDTGIGIETQYQEKIFGEFFQIENEYTKKYEGTGLGLSLARKRVGLLGGKIWVESEGAGKGSAFKFTVPLGERG